MAGNTLDHAFFYNSQDNDRVYDAESFEYWLKKFFTTGVFSGDCQVTANDNMTVTAGAGYANVEGKVKFFADAQILQLETAGSTYPRIDTIVIERNDTDRDVTMKVVTGGYSSTPQPTAPVRSNGVYQLVIAQVMVEAGAVRISQSDITDTRLDNSVCGIVAQAVEHIETEQFYAQIQSDLAEFKNVREADILEWQSDFEANMQTYFAAQQSTFAAWFSQIQGQLTDDAAGKLQEQINAIKYFYVLENTLYVPNTSSSVSDGVLMLGTTEGGQN